MWSISRLWNDTWNTFKKLRICIFSNSVRCRLWCPWNICNIPQRTSHWNEAVTGIVNTLEMSSTQVGPEFEQIYMMNCAMKYILFKLQMPATNLLQVVWRWGFGILICSLSVGLSSFIETEEFSFENCSSVCWFGMVWPWKHHVFHMILCALCWIIPFP